MNIEKIRKDFLRKGKIECKVNQFLYLFLSIVEVSIVIVLLFFSLNIDIIWTILACLGGGYIAFQLVHKYTNAFYICLSNDELVIKNKNTKRRFSIKEINKVSIYLQYPNVYEEEFDEWYYMIGNAGGRGYELKCERRLAIWVNKKLEYSVPVDNFNITRLKAITYIVKILKKGNINEVIDIDEEVLDKSINNYEICCKGQDPKYTAYKNNVKLEEKKTFKDYRAELKIRFLLVVIPLGLLLVSMLLVVLMGMMGIL